MSITTEPSRADTDASAGIAHWAVPILLVDEIGPDRYAQGAVDFITAPIDVDELRAKVSVFANLFIQAEVVAAKAREVQRSADQLRLLTETAPIGIFQTDAEDRYTYTNARWTEITGVTSDAAQGQPWDILVDDAQRARMRGLEAPRAEVRARPVGLPHRGG